MQTKRMRKTQATRKKPARRSGTAAQKRPAGARTVGGLDRLVAFHGEIRAALGALAAFAEEAPSGARARSTARRLGKLLGGALFDHEEAESNLLVPMLQASPAPEAQKLAESTHKGHARLDELRKPVLDGLAVLAAAGGELPSGLARSITLLVSGLGRHLDIEETKLYPLAKGLLSADDDRRLATQLRGLKKVNKASRIGASG